MIDGDNGTDDSVDPTCVEYVRRLGKMWMRLTERMREFIVKVGCCMLDLVEVMIHVL